MRFFKATTLLALLGAANAASSWGFKDGSVTVSSKSSEDVVEK
jgi:oligosaccharyltransferase complex subunit delta (ribophorin II)